MTDEREPYVVTFRKSTGAPGRPAVWYSEVIDARSPGEAAQSAIASDSWSLDDGTYEVRVAKLAASATITAVRSTQTSVVLDETVDAS